MKYELMIRSRPTEDILQRHEKLMALLSSLGNEWGLIEGAEIPTVKDPRTDPRREVNLSRCFRKGIKASVSYQNRRYFEDEAMYDDYFSLEFNPHKSHYKLLCNRVFCEYIEAFGAYLGEIGDVELVHLDFDRSRKIQKRNGVYRIYPVSFFDGELCARAFHLTPEEVARRVTPAVERATVLTNGVCVLASSEVVTVDEANAINRRLKRRLAGAAQRHQESGRVATPAEPRRQDLASPSLSQGHVEWVDRNAYVMPELPESLRVDPVLAALIHVVSFLELSDDDTVDPDAAVKAMEHVGFYRNRLPARQIAAIREQFDRIAAHAQAQGWDQEAVEFFTELMGNAGLGDEDD
ncbi:MAG: hypothetical protein ACYC61_12525 [Isosphaeraceae bacterium]